jgi:hypothetical protein
VKRAFRVLTVTAICVSLVFNAAPPRPARAEISGTTWTCIIICGGALAFYLTKLSIDNGKADDQGRHVDALIDKDWLTLPNGSPMPKSNLRYVRGELIDTVIADATAPDKYGQLQKYRANYESLRTCWNAFVYASPAPTAKPSESPSTEPSAKPTVKPTERPRSKPTVKPTKDPPSDPAAQTTPSSTPAPAGDGSCTQGSDKIITAENLPIDAVDLKSAFANGPSLFSEIISLNVGTYEDDNNLRAAYLYAVANGLELKLSGQAGAAGGVDLTSIATNCVTSLSTLQCISSLGSAESALAADRRKDVACDVAMRAQLPMVTTLQRLRNNTVNFGGSDDHTETPPEGPNRNFGPVPGC